MSAFQSLDQCFLSQNTCLQPENSLLGKAQCVNTKEGLSSSQPHIELLKEGGRLKAIHITCSCGQVMQLECEYPNANT